MPTFQPGACNPGFPGFLGLGPGFGIHFKNLGFGFLWGVVTYLRNVLITWGLLYSRRESPGFQSAGKARQAEIYLQIFEGLYIKGFFTSSKSQLNIEL